MIDVAALKFAISLLLHYSVREINFIRILHLGFIDDENKLAFTLSNYSFIIFLFFLCDSIILNYIVNDLTCSQRSVFSIRHKLLHSAAQYITKNLK